MITFVLLNLSFIAFIYTAYSYIFSRPSNFPPGPPKIPWFGSYIFMLLLDQDHLHRAVNRMCKFYKTSVLGFHLGNDPIIVVNDHENVKKILNNRDFDGRPDILMGRLRHPSFENYGVTFMDGDLWHEQRRFSLRYLRDFGFGRRFDTLEREIEFQITQYMDIIKMGPKYSHENKYFADEKILLPYAFGPTFANIFLYVLLNESIAREDMAELSTVVENVFIFQRKTDNYGKLYSLIPSLAKYFPEKSDYKPGREVSLELYNFFERIINKQVETYDENYDRHFIDMYLRKINENSTTDKKTYFSIDQLIVTCLDFLFPTVSSVPATVAFLLQQICHDPTIQSKIQNEIDSVVGQSRPTLDDRINLPYTEACLREIMRFETLIPSGLPHRALVDTEFMGYTIPKGTFVMPALSAAMHDSTAWEKPDTFMPERFLDSSGKLSLSKDISMPFSAGRRLCIAETFSRNIMFLFITSFLQAFSVRMPHGEKPIEFEDNFSGNIRTPPNYWMHVEIR